MLDNPKTLRLLGRCWKSMVECYFFLTLRWIFIQETAAHKYDTVAICNHFCYVAVHVVNLCFVGN